MDYNHPMRFLLGVSALVAGCSLSHDVSRAADSGTTWDGSTLEPSLDGSADTGYQGEPDAQVVVGPDAGLTDADISDAGPSDAGNGRGQSNYDELQKLVWTPLSWAPAKCNAKVASDVTRLLPVVWTPFPDLVWPGGPSLASNGSGCSQATFFVSGEPHPGGGYEQPWDLGAHGGGPPERALIVFDVQGEPAVAIGFSAGCDLVTGTTGREPCYAFSGFAIPGSIGCGDIVDPALVFHGPSDGELAVGDDLIASASGSVVNIYQRRAPQAEPAAIEAEYALRRLAVHGPTMLGIAEIPADDGEQYRHRLARSDHGGEWEVLRRFVGREVLGMAADETQIAWVEVDSLAGAERRRGTLFTALWPAPGAPLMAVRVRELDDVVPEDARAPSSIALRDGYLVLAAWSEARMYRMSDGARWDVPLPPDEDWSYYEEFIRPVVQPAWLDDTYVTYELIGTGEELPFRRVRCPIADVLKVAPRE